MSDLLSTVVLLFYFQRPINRRNAGRRSNDSKRVSVFDDVATVIFFFNCSLIVLLLFYTYSKVSLTAGVALADLLWMGNEL